MNRRLIPGILLTLALFPLTSCRPRGPELPCSEATDLWGVRHDLRSPDWVLIDFVHSAGCGYCVLNSHEYAENFGEGLAEVGVQTFGVDILEEQRDLIDFIKHHHIDYPILTEPDPLWTGCPGLPGQALFHRGRRLYAASQTLTHRAYDAVRAHLKGVRPFRPGGPLKKAFNCVNEDEKALVVFGDETDVDPREYFSGLREIRFQTKYAREVTAEDLRRHNLYVIGNVGENRLLRELSERVPFKVQASAIAFGDTMLTGDDLGLEFCWPNPWNPERYLIVRTGTGPFRRGFVYDGSQDFVIARWDGPRAGYRPLARGIFQKHDGAWSLPKRAIQWERVESPIARAFHTDCGPGGCPMPEIGDGSRRTPARDAASEWAIEVKPMIVGEGRFPALASAGPDRCWVAWDHPAQGIFVGEITGDACSSQRITGATDAFKATLCPGSSGGCWVAWSERIDDAYQIIAAHIGDEAQRWSISQRRNLDHHSPWLAQGDDGTIWLAWNTWVANGRRPHYRTWRDGDWSAVARVPECGESGFAWYHSGCPAKDGVAYAWMQHYPKPTGIYAAWASDARWSEPVEVCGGGRYPSIAATENETWLVWQMREGFSPPEPVPWSIYVSRHQGDGWTAPEPLPGCRAGRNSTPVVAVDAEGRAWVAWSHKDGEHWQMLCSVHDASGWRGPVVVSDSECDARSPAISASGSSVWVAWHQGIGEVQDVVVASLTTS